MNINPFNDDNGSFFVLVNDEEQHSLRPPFGNVPAGWRVVYGEADGAACVETSSKAGPTYGRRVCARRRQWVGASDN